MRDQAATTTMREHTVAAMREQTATTIREQTTINNNDGAGNN